MSIKAMNWALQQATGDPRAQCLLYVIADCASVEGVAWPSADWLADKSQQSRATVYRRLQALQELGLCTVFPRYIDDSGKMWNEPGPGRRRSKSPEIRLHLDVTVTHTASQDDDDDASQPENDPQSQPENGGGVSLTGETRESHCCDSNKNHHLTEDSPQAPQRGVIEPPLEEFQKAYPIPFTDYERTKSAWSVMTEAERREAITGANGYAMLCRQQTKRNVEDAHRWLRGRKWQGYLTAGEQAAAIAQRFDASEGSEQWQAWTIFYQACGKRTGIPDFQIRGTAPNRIANVPAEWPSIGRGLNPDRSKWFTHVEGGGQFAAALRKLQEVPHAPIQFGQHIENGRYLRTLTVPFEWPPGKSTAA